MKIKILALLAALTFPLLAQAKEIKVSVNGMVCSFCAQGITKKFEKIPGVEEVNVSLEKKMVSLKMEENKELPDEKIKELITSAGYNVEKIERAQ